MYASSAAVTKKYKHTFYDPGTGTVYFQWVPSNGTLFFTIDVYGVFADYLDREMESVKTEYYVIKPDGKGNGRNRPVSYRHCTSPTYNISVKMYNKNDIIVSEFISGTVSRCSYRDEWWLLNCRTIVVIIVVNPRVEMSRAIIIILWYYNEQNLKNFSSLIICTTDVSKTVETMITIEIPSIVFFLLFLHITTY